MSQGPAAKGFGFFSAVVDPSAGILPHGCPVYVSSTGTLLPCEANASASSAFIGFLPNGGHAGEIALVQYTGFLALPLAAWNSLTGSSTGLTPGARYLVSSTEAGALVSTAPSIEGTFVSRVGLALSANVMAITRGGPATSH